MNFKFYHNNINVLDLEKSLKFYNDALNLKETKRIEAEDGSFIIVYLGDSQTSHFLELTWLRDRKEPYNLGDNEFHLALHTDNYEEALKWFRKGAEKGEAWVIGNVGHMYHWGYGVNQDYVEAMKWYKKAVDLNDDWAMNRIGILYRDGLGVTANIEEAKKWFKKAADLGNDEAKDNLNSL